MESQMVSFAYEVIFEFNTVQAMHDVVHPVLES